MGQQSSSQTICQDLTKPNNHGPQDLVFYLTVEDRQFGTVPVYSSTKRPSSYVAKVQKPVQNSKIYNIFQQIQNTQLSCLASLHAFEITRQKYCTGHLKQKITAYWEYYNYSFEDFLKMRFLKRIPFSENELWLIIKSCCQAFSVFSFHQLVLDLDLRHIMVVPEGKLKLYWHNLELKNTHLWYNQKIRQTVKQRKSVTNELENRNFRVQAENYQDSFFFSPEEIEGIDRKQETLKINFACANSFRLGMIILYCVTLTNPIKTCYGINNVTGERRLKHMVLNSLYEGKIENSHKFSDGLKHLMKMLLLEDPNKRIPIDRIEDVYQRYIHVQGELAMGMGVNQNPIYMPSSSRKNLKEEQPRNKFIKSKGFLQNNLSVNPSIVHHKELSNFNSQKVIEQSRVKSCEREVDEGNRNIESGYSIEPQAFDKFDTKTIKISSSYHNRR